MISPENASHCYAVGYRDGYNGDFMDSHGYNKEEAKHYNEGYDEGRLDAKLEQPTLWTGEDEKELSTLGILVD